MSRSYGTAYTYQARQATTLANASKDCGNDSDGEVEEEEEEEEV